MRATPELKEKQQQLLKTMDALNKARTTLRQAQSDLAGHTAAEADEMLKAGLITPEGAEEFKRSIGALEMIVAMHPRTIEALENQEEDLMNEIAYLKSQQHSNSPQALVTIAPILAVICSVIGIITYYTGFPVATYICAAITIADSLIQIIWGDQNNPVTEIVTAVIGLIIALIAQIPILPCIAVALCFGTAIVTLLGIIGRLASTRSF